MFPKLGNLRVTDAVRTSKKQGVDMAALMVVAVLLLAALARFLFTHILFSIGGRLIVTQFSDDLIVLRERRWGNPNSCILRNQKNGETMLVSSGIGSLLFPVYRARMRVLRQTLHAWNARLTHLWVISGFPVYWGVGNPLRTLLDPSCTLSVLPDDRGMLLHMDSFVKIMEDRARGIGAHFRENAWVRMTYCTWPWYRRVFFGPGLRYMPAQMVDPPSEPFDYGVWRAEPAVLWGDGAELSLFLTHSITKRRIGIVGAIVPPLRGIPRDDLPACYLPGSDPIKALDGLRALAARNLHILIPVHGEPIIGSTIIQRRLSRMIRQTQLVIGKIRSFHLAYPDWSAARLADIAFRECGYPNSRLFGENERQMWARSVVFTTSGELLP